MVFDLSHAVFDRLQAVWAASGLRAGQSKPMRILNSWQGWLLDRALIAKPFIPRPAVLTVRAALPAATLDAVQGLLRRSEDRPGHPDCNWPFRRLRWPGRI